MMVSGIFRMVDTSELAQVLPRSCSPKSEGCMYVHGDNPEFSSEEVGPPLDMLAEIGRVIAAHRAHCYGDN